MSAGVMPAVRVAHAVLSRSTSIPARCAGKGTNFVIVLLLSGVAWLSDAAGGDKASRIVYPETKRVDQVDVYHGTKVPDPYRWLEEDVRESKDVAAWVEAQNKVTFAYLETIPQRKRIIKQLTE